MSWIAVAIAGSAALSAYENKRAGDISAGAADRAGNLQYQMFQQNQANQAPWLKAGQEALTQMETGTRPGGEFAKPFTMADYQADPGYQFRLQQGQQGIQNQAAAQGQFYSPNFINSATRFNQDQASQEYGNAYNRYVSNQTNTFNRLASLSGLGQTSANQIGTAGQNYATNAGNAGMASAQARGQGAVGATNALQGGVGNYMYYNTLQNYMNRMGGGGGGPSTYSYDPNAAYGTSMYGGDPSSFGRGYAGVD